jgi:hypothetical protein
VPSAVGQGAAPRRQKARESPTWRQVGTPSAAALTLPAVFLGSYIAMTLTWGDFAYYEYFTLLTVKRPQLRTGNHARDRTLLSAGFHEFNLISHFTDTITGYHVLPVGILYRPCSVTWHTPPRRSDPQYLT